MCVCLSKESEKHMNLDLRKTEGDCKCVYVGVGGADGVRLQSPPGQRECVSLETW
jgi:hypothetical protein